MEIPRSVAFIPDGNRRWAKNNEMLPSEGHRQGVINGRVLTEALFKMGVQHVVFWGASESNFMSRPLAEIKSIFQLFKAELKERMRRNDKVAFRVCGNWQQWSKDPTLPELVGMVEKKTASYVEHQLTLLFGYDGEVDNEQANQQLFDAGIRPTKELIRQHLWTAHLPDIDLIIRTGVEGDPHDSDAFLPLQRKNTQLVFSQRCWPSFGTDDLKAALAQYGAREKRKGS